MCISWTPKKYLRKGHFLVFFTISLSYINEGNITFLSTDNVQKRIRAKNCTKILNPIPRYATPPKRNFNSKTENSQLKGSRLIPGKMTEKKLQPNPHAPIKPNREKETEPKGKPSS